MRRTRTWLLVAFAGTLIAGVLPLSVGWAGVTGFISSSTATTVPAAGAIYVSSIKCPTTGADGTAFHPFCDIASAAAVVQPGGTVYVEPGNYPAPVSITNNGTASAPITFEAVHSHIGHITNGPLTVTGASHVVLRGLEWNGTIGNPVAVEINQSTDVTIDGGFAAGIHAPEAVHVAGSAQNVVITRNVIQGGSGDGVVADAGATGLIVSSNMIYTSNLSGLVGVQVTGVTGASITGNTVQDPCGVAIAVNAGSTQAVIENNILQPSAQGFNGSKACPQPLTAAAAVVVSADSVNATVADYNLIDPASGLPPYAWAGTAYGDLSAFHSATGQGGHDLAATPVMFTTTHADHQVWAMQAGSPGEDSADLNAPGQTPSDLFDNFRADDPATPNTGTGVGYADRGAVEQVGQVTPGMGDLTPVPGQILTAEVSNSAQSGWPTNGPIGFFSYDITGFPFTVVTRDASLTWTFQRAGEVCVNSFESPDGFVSGEEVSTCAVLGAQYQPVTPTRVLDTRAKIGVSTTTPVTAGGDLVLNVPVPGSPVVSALVLNVTVTAPTTAGFLTVYPHGQSLPGSSNLNFVTGQTVANLVTVPVTDGSVVFHNGSGGTVHVVADLAGYYSATGAGFASLPPVRVLDTRNGTGYSGTKPLAAFSALTLDVSGKVPPGTTAVSVNLTETAATGAGYLTAFPAGQARPIASNLNFTAGSTVANAVIVPVAGGKATIYNGSGGTVHVIADLNGYFGGGATDQYVPFGPVRLLDTRDAAAVARGADAEAFPDTNNCLWCPPATAAVYNITVTAPNTFGFATAFPVNATAIPLASTLNFAPGQTVPNLATVKDGPGILVYNGSGGPIQVIVDEFGYYIAAP
jgi:hypothetical protein